MRAEMSDSDAGAAPLRAQRALLRWQGARRGSQEDFDRHMMQMQKRLGRKYYPYSIYVLN